MKTVCGLDIHKSMILMCILKENGTKVIQEFSTLTWDVESIRDLMKEHSVNLSIMCINSQRDLYTLRG
jgi:hypothetical protein